MLTRSRSLTLMMLTQKILWAEFLWASNVHMKKNSGSNDIDTEDSTGRIPMGETLSQRKKSGSDDMTQKILWADLTLWVERSHEENP